MASLRISRLMKHIPLTIALCTEQGRLRTSRCCGLITRRLGLPYVAFRYFNAYGPRMDTVGVYTEVMIRWLDAIEANQPPLIFGHGKQSMDFVFIDDIARANLLAAQSDVTDEAFNVGTGVQTSLNELCHLMLELNDSRMKPEYREARKSATYRRDGRRRIKRKKCLVLRVKLRWKKVCAG